MLRYIAPTFAIAFQFYSATVQASAQVSCQAIFSVNHVISQIPGPDGELPTARFEIPGRSCAASLSAECSSEATADSCTCISKGTDQEPYSFAASIWREGDRVAYHGNGKADVSQSGETTVAEFSATGRTAMASEASFDAPEQSMSDYWLEGDQFGHVLVPQPLGNPPLYVDFRHTTADRITLRCTYTP